MQLNLNLPNSVVRKLKALSALEEIEDFEQFVTGYLEAAIEDRIMEIIQSDKGSRKYPEVAQVSTTRAYRPAVEAVHQTSEFDVAAGLSHEELDEAPPKPKPAPAARKPRPKKLTTETLAQDDVVANPKVEAVSHDGEQMTFEELVGSTLTDDSEELPPVNIPPLEELSSVPRSNPRPLPKGVKARVSTFEHIEEAM